MDQNVLSITQLTEYIRGRLDDDPFLGQVAVRGRGEGTLTAALAAGAAAYLLAWLVGAAIGDPTFRTGGLYLTAAIFGGAGAAGLLGSRPRKKRRDARPPIRKSVRRK